MQVDHVVQQSNVHITLTLKVKSKYVTMLTPVKVKEIMKVKKEKAQPMKGVKIDQGRAERLTSTSKDKIHFSLFCYS